MASNTIESQISNDDKTTFDIFGQVASIHTLCNQVIVYCDVKGTNKPALPHCGKFHILMTSIITLLNLHFDVHSKQFNINTSSNISKSSQNDASLATLLQTTTIVQNMQTLEKLLIQARNMFQELSHSFFFFLIFVLFVYRGAQNHNVDML